MPVFPSQGGSKGTWGTELRSFFSPYFDLATSKPIAAYVDAASYALLSDALTAAAGKTLLIGKNFTLIANTTIPSTVSIEMLKGGSFTKASTFTLTINGPFDAGLYQVFSGFSAGDVTFGAGAVKEVYPEWWGIDGTADDVQINSAINATTEPFVKLQSNKTYYIADILLFSSVSGGMFQGGGMRSTILQWTGASSTDPMFRLFGVRDFVLKDFSTVSSSGVPLYEVFRVETLSGFTNTNIRFENIWIQGTNAGGLQYGIRTITGTGGDNNNDNMFFASCHFNNYSLAAIKFTHSQSKGHVITHCTFSGGTLGDYAIDGRGSWTLFEGMGGYHNVADFHSENTNDYIKVYGWNGEGSDRLYLHGTVGGGGTGAGMPVLLQGIRFATNGINADGYIIYYQHTGPLLFMDSLIGESTQGIVQIYINTNASQNSVTVSGVSFQMNNAESKSPFVFGGAFKGPINASGILFRNLTGSDYTTKGTIFDDADTTPAVFYKEGIYKASNTGATSITDFDAGTSGEIPDQWIITIYFTNNNTTIVHGAGVIELDGGANFNGNTGDTLTLMRDHGNTKWIEISRMDIS